MNANDIDDAWGRWIAVGRLQAQWLARHAEILEASLTSMRQRGSRAIELWFWTPWPGLISRVDGPVVAGARWADYLEDEARNATQMALLADWEMRNWGERFARTIEGDESG